MGLKSIEIEIRFVYYENFKADAICSYDSLMAEWPLAFLKLHILRNRYLLSWSFIEQTNKQIEIILIFTRPYRSRGLIDFHGVLML